MSSCTAAGPTSIAPALLIVYPPLRREDLPGLFGRTCALLQTGPDLLLCDVAGIPPDAVAADALARLKLAARRNDVPLRFRGASPELLALLGLMGLRDAIGA